MSASRLLDAGEAALVVEFGTTVDPATNARVLALDAALTSLALAGVRETVPTYRSLMVHYDPLVIDRANLIAAIEKVEAVSHAPVEAKNRWTVPCCYEPDLAEDIGAIAELTGLSIERVVALHSGISYRVYMYGFAPGFCYLSSVAPELAISRRATPRPPHPPNVVLLGGGLTLVATFSMPTGWYVIGRTPERMFALSRQPNFIIEVGDELRFQPIERSTFDALEARAAAGEIVAKRERLR